MTKAEKVVWTEGMFLRPHHFQRTESYLLNHVREWGALQRSYLWGFLDLELDEAMLRQGCIALSYCSGLLPDGTFFQVRSDRNGPAPLKIPDNLTNEKVVLALPDGRLHLRIRDFSGNMQEIPKKTYTKWFDYGKIKSGLRLRRRESGDYLKIDAAGHTKKLKEYFVNEKIPAAKRDAIWLLATGSEILWVAGGRIGAGCKVGENTEKILEVHFFGGNYHESKEY